MIVNHTLRIAVLVGLSCLSASAAAQSVAQMDSAPVTAAPSAGALGAAEFAASAKISAPRVLSLAPLTRADVSTLQAQRVQQEKDGLPLQIGFNRDVQRGRVDLNTLAWQPLADGGHAARFEMSSEGAVALRAALSLSGAGAKSARLHFGGNDGRVFESRGGEFAGAAPGWSPVVMGDTLVIELVLAKGVNPKALRLNVPRLSHLDASPIEGEKGLKARIGASGSCNKDIVCRVNPPAGFVSTAKSVAHMIFTNPQGTFICSGTLLNNNHSPKKQLFWTAAHCFTQQSVADTLQTYWLFDATTCGGSTANPAYSVLTGGAFVRHSNTTRDTSLLELKTAPPAGAVYAGWSNTLIGSTNTAVEGIHHPSGDLKKYSLGTVTGLSASALGSSPLYRVVWNLGTTEGGSSGSGLFTVTSSGGYQLRGGLYGGTSYCSAPRDPDYYSRFSDIYSSVSSYFNP